MSTGRIRPCETSIENIVKKGISGPMTGIDNVYAPDNTECNFLGRKRDGFEQMILSCLRIEQRDSRKAMRHINKRQSYPTSVFPLHHQDLNALHE